MRVIAWHTVANGETGQKVVTEFALSVLKDYDLKVLEHPSGLISALPKYLGSVLRMLWLTYASRKGVVYIVNSRSVFGFLRDTPALLLARRHHKVIVHCHGSDLANLLEHPVVGALARILYRPTQLVLPSEHLKASLEHWFNSPPIVIENFAPNTSDRAAIAGISATDHDQIDQRITNGGPQVTVLWNSNIISSKGFFDISDAIAHWASRGVDVRLLAIGAPVADAELSRTACNELLQRHTTRSYLEYVGPVDANTAVQMLCRADAVALNSRYPTECQPLAVVSAMARGIPVILNDTPALRATAGDYPAIFCKSPDLEGGICAVGELIDNFGDIKEKCADAAANVTKRFSKMRFASQVRQIVGRE